MGKEKRMGKDRSEEEEYSIRLNNSNNTNIHHTSNHPPHTHKTHTPQPSTPIKHAGSVLEGSDDWNINKVM